jgi:hypothetical protein
MRLKVKFKFLCLAFVLLFLLLKFCLPAGVEANMANPSQPGAAGAEPSGLEQVYIASETLSIDLRKLAEVTSSEDDQTILVEVIYVIENQGAERQLELVFAFGSHFKEFQIWLDEREITSQNISNFSAPESWRPPGKTPWLNGREFEYSDNSSAGRALVVKKGGGFIFTEPKTKKSRRSIPISNSLIDALKTHRRNQLEGRMKLGASYQNFDLVFASEIGTPLLHGNLLSRHFKPIRDKAGLPSIRLYDLRHTTATLLLSAGENPKIVSERLGHASIVLTLDTYSHVLPSMQKEATNKIEKLMLGKIKTFDVFGK